MEVMLTVFFGSGTAWGQLATYTPSNAPSYPFSVYHYYPGYTGSSYNYGYYEGSSSIQFGKDYIYFTYDGGYPYHIVKCGVVDPNRPVDDELDPNTIVNSCQAITSNVYGVKPRTSWAGKKIKIYVASTATNAGVVYINQLLCHPQITPPNTNTACCSGTQITVKVKSNYQVDVYPTLKYVYVDKYDVSNNTFTPGGTLLNPKYVEGEN